MKSIEARVTEIEKRNVRVESDKAWETSIVRRGLITVLTYITIVIFLIVIDNPRPLVNSLVPCIGFVLSTSTVAWIKLRWIARRATSKTSKT